MNRNPQELFINRADLGKLPNLAPLVGIAGAVVVLLGLIFESTRLNFFLGYLAAFIFWTNLALGSLLLLMIQYLSGGDWGVVLRRVLETGSRMVYWIPVLFIPVALGSSTIYEWMHHDIVAGDRILREKSGYLNPGFWFFRQFIYFAIWGGLAYLLNTWGKRHEESVDHRYLVRMRMLSGPGIVIYVLCITFASVDWIMALEPHWYSTMFGGIFGIGQLLGGMSFATAVIVLLARFRPVCDILQRRHMHDYGKLMLAFTMLWAYVNFSQFMIIWAGNIPEETFWYMGRLRGGWQYLGGMIIAFHFIIPFLLLLSQGMKKNPRTLVPIAFWILGMRCVDIFWQSVPSSRLHHGHAGASDTLTFSAVIGMIAALAAIGGAWLTIYFRELIRRPMLPLADPYLEKALEHGH